MSVSIKNIEESLSVSYVSAIVAKSGASFDIVSRDYGVDICVRRVEKFGGNYMDMGVSFDCQLKSSINWDADDKHIIYDLEAKTYNKLVYRHMNSTTPCFLVLLCLPRNEDNWICISENELNLRKCCYFYYIDGEPTMNKSTIRIKIPRKNLFSPDIVNNIINKVLVGEIV